MLLGVPASRAPRLVLCYPHGYAMIAGGHGLLLPCPRKPKAESLHKAVSKYQSMKRVYIIIKYQSVHQTVKYSSDAR